MPLTRTISLVEVMWLLGALPGFFYMTRVFRRAVGDLYSLKKRRINSIREFAARVVVFTYGTWALVEFAFVVIGGIAMLVPTPSNQQISATGYVITAVLLIIDFLLSGAAFTIERWRSSLIALIHEFEDMEGK